MAGLSEKSMRVARALLTAGPMGWGPRLVARRWAGVLLAAYAFGTDRLISWHGLGFVLRGLVDEPAHIATALVVLGAITRFRHGSPPDPRFCATMLISSVLIDVDHLPAEFGSNALTDGTPRPYTHALWTVLVFIFAWAITRYLMRRTGHPAATAEFVLAGAAWGLAAHFLRDIATAPMSFWWPISNMSVEVPYWWYVLALLFIAIGPVRHRNSRTGAQERETELVSGNT